ncbi:GAF domain-containing protein [Ramlibacter tataouinensis]|uniref:GAF domain-containing protein n=1 Tax=Ramlibacter tataouinensis TaxID=94132 RepID=UPI0022F3FA19|nr:GAF domain-containing protein [Ramlibacter tataouinensis]WBY01210.1 GAF domain-containing protein [Ramlibacter tataouinensis]
MLLEPMLSRLGGAKTLDEKIQAGLHDVVALHGAEMGNVQFPGSDGRLVIVAARGLGLAFLKTFERVAVGSSTVCGRAARSGKPVFVPDVRVDEDFKPYVDFANSVPFRSVLSFPLVSSAGEFVGMVSAHSAHVLAPTELELRSGETYGRHLADAVVSLAPAPERVMYAERRSAELIKLAR